jgi:hypothetical protein
MESIEVAFGIILKQNFVLVTKLKRSNVVENLSVTVENLDGMSQLTSNLIINEYLRLQWGHFVGQKQLRSPQPSTSLLNG